MSTEQKTENTTSSIVLKDRFELLRLLGKGGMGSVYFAKDRRREEAQDQFPYIAVKVLNKKLRSYPKAIISLQREARKTQQLAHPNIVSVYDFDRDGEIFFYTMEYLSGVNLATLFAKYKGVGLPREMVYPIISQLCDALTYAHQRNYVHYDLKPGNIFLEKSGKLKILDFGIAQAFRVEEGSDQEIIPKGLHALTPAYASPEMLAREPPQPTDDIFSLSCLIYEMLSGWHPYCNLPADQAKEKAIEPRPIPGLTRRQWRGLQQGLAFNCQQRIREINSLKEKVMLKKNNFSSIWWLGLSIIIIFSIGMQIIVSYQNDHLSVWLDLLNHFSFNTKAQQHPLSESGP